LKSLVIALAFFLVLFLTLPAAASAQSKGDPPIPPFYHTYAGLYYPAIANFRETFGVPSDFVWGTGFGMPISPDFLYLILDFSWFQANGYQPGPPAGEHEMSVAFWHLGLLDKVFIAKTIALRVQGGANYNSAEIKFTPLGAPESKVELKRKFGFFGGVGLENLLFGGKMGLFADVIYDYRRSTDPQIFGDFGGTRVVAGLEAFLF
jgi:hypothetical protein